MVRTHDRPPACEAGADGDWRRLEATVERFTRVQGAPVSPAVARSTHLSRKWWLFKSAVVASMGMREGCSYLSGRAVMFGAGCRVGAVETALSKTGAGGYAGPGEYGSASRVSGGQAAFRSSSRKVWKTRLPILRATVSLATVALRRSRVAR